MGTSIPDIPNIKDTTIMALKQQLTNILMDYPWELPLWFKILIIIVLTLLTVVIILITCCMCGQCGNCLIEQYLSSKWDKDHKQISNREKNNDTNHPTPSKQ